MVPGYLNSKPPQYLPEACNKNTAICNKNISGFTYWTRILAEKLRKNLAKQCTQVRLCHEVFCLHWTLLFCFFMSLFVFISVYFALLSAVSVENSDSIRSVCYTQKLYRGIARIYFTLLKKASKGEVRPECTLLFPPCFIKCNCNIAHWKREKTSVQTQSVSCFLCEIPLTAIAGAALICVCVSYDEPVNHSLVLLCAWLCAHVWTLICKFNECSWLIIYVGTSYNTELDTK